MSETASILHLFEAIGIELEYMIVDRETLDVRPFADRVLVDGSGEPALEIELGDIAWSNELVLHVLEMKTNGPARTLDGWTQRFDESVRRADAMLEKQGCRLLPSGMHPWMDPHRDAALWPHEQNDIYRAYDRIFGTGGHGWVNLQSTHVNLPFCGDEEFVRLHAAIRAVLPLLPALAASSPFVEGKRTGILDNRLEFYRNNQRRVPSIAGGVIPDPVGSQDEYQERILKTIYRDIAPFDPEGILQYEWLNSRGAIARFDRRAIEIRLLDIQESPRADLAVIAAVVAAVRALTEERWARIDDLQKIPSDTLRSLWLEAIRLGGQAHVADRGVLSAFGLFGENDRSMREVWQHLISTLVDPLQAAREGWDAFYSCLLKEGTLADRLLAATDVSDDRASIKRVYKRLANVLRRGEIFHAS